MKRWIKKHSRETLIASIVFLGHLFVIFYNFKTTHIIPIPKQSIIVHTHTEQKPKPKSQFPSKSKSKPKTQQAPVKKKQALSAKKSKRQKALKKLEETLAKIEKKEHSLEIDTPFLPPKEIQHLHIDQVIENPTQEEISYLALFVQALRNKLKLPEEGSVRLQLTLLQSGRVEKVRFLYTESENNKRYLERELIHLQLPPFSDELAGKMQHTFTLNFCHEN